MGCPQIIPRKRDVNEKLNTALGYISQSNRVTWRMLDHHSIQIGDTFR